MSNKGLIVESERLFYKDNHNWIFKGDARSMWELPNECVQMVCTSPPYWSLRKYSGEQDLIWGGDKDCEHKWEDETIKHDALRHRPSEKCIVGSEKNPAIRPGSKVISGFCSLCGAWRGALGLEPTIELYLQHLIEIMREIRRVLRKDGVFFLNIGDSYAGSGSPGGDFRDGKGGDEYLRPYNRKGGVLKPKDLCLVPFRVAISAQEDGWWVRSVIIWSKNNPMPSSSTDRPTVSHEYILMLTKSGKSLYWTHRDGGGTRERPKADYKWVNIKSDEEVAIEPPDWKVKIKCPECDGTGYVDMDALWSISDKCPTCNGKGKTQLWKRINLWTGHDYYWDQEAVREPYTEPLNRWGGDSLKRDTSKTAAYKEMQNIGYSSAFRVGRPMRPDPSGRNIRSVWEFPTVPYPGAHFAVFPDRLPQLCIKAATPEEGCCAKCGAPWARVLEKKPSQFNIRVRDAKTGRAAPEEGYKASEEELARYPGNHPDPGYSRTLGWEGTCKCNAPRVPSLVLDPLMGAGTTLEEAKKLNRYAAGYDLAEEYCQLTVERCRQQVLL